MTTAVMKSRNIASSFQRTGGDVGSNRSSCCRRSRVVYPQWMRTLEEKYKRLHLKITRSTSSMNHMYNSNIGRTINDSKLIRAGLLRPERDQNTKQCVNKTKINPKIETPPSSAKVRIAATEISVPQETSVEQLGNKENTKSDSDDDNSSYSDSNQGAGCDSNISIADDSEFEKDLAKEILENSGHDCINTDNMDSTNLKKAGLRTKKKRVYILNHEQLSQTGGEIATVKNDVVIKEEYVEPFITQLGRHVNQEPYVRTKTSTSRRSTVTQKTSKSCPAKMENNNNQGKVQNKSIPNLRAKSAQNRSGSCKRQFKVFSRMSMEAQHAMSETMKEVKPSNTHDVHVNYEREKTKPMENNYFVPAATERTRIEDSLNSQCHKNKTQKFRTEDDIYDPNFAVQEIIQDDAYSDSELSISSRKRPLTSNTARTRLPFIPSETNEFFTLGQIKHMNYRLPGIGKYEIATLKEKTFEITPPGYDIRYNDIAIFEEGENELPPADIRDRAVQKCQDWLSRYTPR